jgi:hypothetical protein
MSEHIRIMDGFKTLSDPELVATAETVVKGTTDNPAIPNASEEVKALEGAVVELKAAMAAQAQGGTAATAEKNVKRNALLALLRKLAHNVQDNCGGSLAVVLSCGFVPRSNSRTRSPLDTPSIVSVDIGDIGELVLKVTSIARAKSYHVQCSANTAGSTPDWKEAGVFTDPRSIRIKGLVPGTIYSFQVRAVGGSTGYSRWSNPVSRMCA